MKQLGYVILLFIIGLSLLFIDFTSKAFIKELLPLAPALSAGSVAEVSVFQGFLGGIDFSLTLAYNRGIALGFFNAFPVVILIFRLLVVLSMLLYLFFFRKFSSYDFPFMLIIAGALGNVIDFFLYGAVIDFVHFHFWGYSFPIFNLADACISVGVIWLFLQSFMAKPLSNEID